MILRNESGPLSPLSLYKDYIWLGLFGQTAGFAFLGNLGEEVVALVIHENECGEVFNFNFPDSFHPEFGVFQKFHFLDAVFGENRSRTADRAEVEAAMFVTCVCYLFAAVALGYHYH